MKRYSPGRILSDNSKCGVSINLPIKGHCRPTKVCVFCCYARTGNTARPASTRKQAWVSKYLRGPDLSGLVEECRNLQAVRLNGSGDLNPEHLPGLVCLAEQCPSTQFWGMTRKTEIANTLNHPKLPNLKILVTVDAASPMETWNYKGALCYGPRREGDQVPDDDRIITVFPRHFAGKVVGIIPLHSRDCPAVRHTVSGCLNCGRCWNWR